MKQAKIERMKAKGTYQNNKNYKKQHTYSNFDPIVAIEKGKPITASKFKGNTVGAIETSKNRDRD